MEGRKPLNERQVFRLYLGKEALLEAQTEAQDPSPFSLMAAIWRTDLAVEIITTTLLDYLELAINPRKEYMPQFIEHLLAKVPTLAVYKASLEMVHNLRNVVQHYGRIPHLRDAHEVTVIGLTFARDAVKEVTGLVLEEISLTSMVMDAEVRSLLNEAECALRAGDYLTCVDKAALAFETAWGRARQASFGSLQNPDVTLLMIALSELIEDSIHKVLGKPKDPVRQPAPDEARAYEEVEAAIERLVEPLDLAAFGIDLFRYTKFRGLSPAVRWDRESDKWVIIDDTLRTLLGLPPRSPSAHEAAESLDFVVRSVLRLQDRIRWWESETEPDQGTGQPQGGGAPDDQWPF